MSDMDTRLLRRALFLFLIAVVSVVPLGATAAEHLLLSTGNDAISLGSATTRMTADPSLFAVN